MYIVALIGIALMVQGLVMTIFAAFRTTKAWGISVTLVPFANIFYSIYHWRRGKRGFISFCSGLFLWAGTAIMFGEGTINQFWLSKVEQVSSAPSRSELPKDATATPSLEERSQKYMLAEKNKLVQNRIQKPKYKRVSFSQLKHHVGKPTLITLKNRSIKKGELHSIHSGEITLSRQLGSGAMTFEIDRANVHMIKVAE